MTKLSIIISCRNEENYIRKLLDSLDTQLWNFPSKREIIFVFDRSTDLTEEIVGGWISKSAYECHIYHTDCGSLATACNVGIDNATGEFIWFMDPRDWLETDEAIDVVLSRAAKTENNILEFKNAVNCDKKPHNTDSRKWGAIYTREIIGDTRFLGSEAMFVKEVYEKPEVKRGGLAIVAYHHNEDGRW